jgi:citrate lyase gamma subunit
MPLPKINTPTYELTLPSNNKKVRYRPFLVREEKILVLAMESGDQKQITDAIVEIINDCLLTKNVDVAKLPTFDIEYLFLNVRSKSVGETVEVNVTCPDDGKTTVETSINIDDIKVKKDKGHKMIIKLDDKYSMKLKYPSIDQFIENNFDFDNAETNVSQALSMLSTCIDMIYDEEESWDASESTKEELGEFIDQLNTKQFKEVEQFFKTMPKLTHTLKVKNPKTDVESEVVLEGLVSFFS